MDSYDCKKYLVVCSKNRFRSKYAEKWLREFCKSHNVGAYIRSAGLYVSHPDATQVGKFLVQWADMIFVMEEYMKKEIILNYKGKDENIVNLGIPDIFSPSQCHESSEYDGLTVEEADKKLDELFSEKKYWARINYKFLSKVLQARLENIILGA